MKPTQIGSPPHTRGKGRCGCDLPLFHRITPAHAGKSCGAFAHWSAHVGSPPHTRGKGISAAVNWVIVRITPAHAGKRLKNPVKSPFIMLF